MSYLTWLVPIALGMGMVGLWAFLWSMRSGQYEDLDGAAERVLLSNAADTPLYRRGPLQAGTRNKEALIGESTVLICEEKSDRNR